MYYIHYYVMCTFLYDIFPELQKKNFLSFTMRNKMVQPET